MIEVAGLTERYRGRVAVDDVSVRVVPGRVTGFLGPDGSGETTTMRCVLGLTRPTAGTETVLGVPYRELDVPLRRVGAPVDPRACRPARAGAGHRADRGGCRRPCRRCGWATGAVLLERRDV